MEKNEWLRMNKKMVDAAQYQMTEVAYKNEFQSIPLGQWRGLLGAAVVEIRKLQNRVDELETIIKGMKSEPSKEDLKTK